jgi:hypothetical protein
MTANPLIAQVIAARTAARLVLMFDIPSRQEPFTCYPKDEASKQKWLEQAEANGWTRI